MKYNILVETWDVEVSDALIEEIMAFELDWEMIQTDLWDKERVVLMGCSHVPKHLPFFMSVID